MNNRDFNLKVFADRLKDLRCNQKITQNQLAKNLELSNASISYWESMKQEPTAFAIFKIANFFSVSADFLLGLEK